MRLIVPVKIEAIILQIDSGREPLTPDLVRQGIVNAHDNVIDLTESEKYGAWAEILAFSLVNVPHDSSPWNTHYGPVGTVTDANGDIMYCPDIMQADERVIAHWTMRVQTVSHPVLRARYADLIWDLSNTISKLRRDPAMARVAIDSYLISLQQDLLTEPHDRFSAVERALNLALHLNDKIRVDQVRQAFLGLHRVAMYNLNGFWWVAFDRLIGDSKARTTADESNELIADMEKLIARFSDAANNEVFDPHETKRIAQRLIRHYTRHAQDHEVRRLYAIIARAFEHFANLGDPLLASVALQTAVTAYRDARMPEKSRQMRVLMQEQISRSKILMKPIEARIEIPLIEMDNFVKSILSDNFEAAFFHLATTFVPRKSRLEEHIQKMAKETPLQAHIPMSIMADDHVVAVIGSVKDDPAGRLIDAAKQEIVFSELWLREALSKTVETYDLTPEHFVMWVARSKLFDDLSLLHEGVIAWYDDDVVKAVHVLVPQIEQGLRSIAAKLGRPVTKALSDVKNASVAIGMGDILYDSVITAELGDDLVLYFRCLYADPRGLNLRNRIAHGTIKFEVIDAHLCRLIIHTLLVLGIWAELSISRKK